MQCTNSVYDTICNMYLDIAHLHIHAFKVYH